MEQLETLHKKIRTAGELHAVVRTMKAMAAVNIRQFEAAARSLALYREVVDSGWQTFFRFRGRLPQKKRPHAAILLLIGSDQGMCGSFNDAVIQESRAVVRSLRQKKCQVIFWTVGERVVHLLGPESSSFHFSVANTTSAIIDNTWAIVRAFESWRGKHGVDILHVLWNRPVHPIGFTQKTAQILPLDQHWQKQLRTKWPSRCLPLEGLAEKDLFHQLFLEHLFVSIGLPLVQSLAAENGARLMAMQAAEKNISEMSDDLKAKYRAVRQENITEELFDVIAGFEAMERT